MSQNKNYIILIGSLIIFFVSGYLLMTYKGEKNIQSPSTLKNSIKIAIPKVEESQKEINLKSNLTENAQIITTEDKLNNTPRNKESTITSPKNEFLFVDQIVNVEEKVKTILNRLIPDATKYRKLDLEKFNTLLLFAYNNFTTTIPSDKNSDEFINICNQKNELFHQLKKSNLKYDSKKIDNLCL
jgi:ribosomal protein L17